MNKVIGFVVMALGFVSGGLCFYAGKQLGMTGVRLTTLASRGGESVAEVYYQQIGHFGISYSLLAYAMGTAIIMVGLGLGALLLSQAKRNVSQQNAAS